MQSEEKASKQKPQTEENYALTHTGHWQIKGFWPHPFILYALQVSLLGNSVNRLVWDWLQTAHRHLFFPFLQS